MRAALRSELVKATTVRTVYALAAATLALMALGVVATLIASEFDEGVSLASETEQRQFLQASSVAALFALVVGALLMTHEFRHGTITPTFLAEPRRHPVVLAKVVVAAAVGAVLGLAAELLAVAIALPGLELVDVDRLVSNDDLVALTLRAGGATALAGALGAALGAVIRNQVAAIVGLLVWVLVAEEAMFALLPRVGRYLPGPAVDALGGATDAEALAPAVGALLALGYVALLTVAGAVVTARRDVS